jgi:hypothetical protein
MEWLLFQTSVDIPTRDVKAGSEPPITDVCRQHGPPNERMIAEVDTAEDIAKPIDVALAAALGTTDQAIGRG